MPPRNIRRVPGLVRRLNEVVKDLEGAFPERTFTLDGHLVGSIGDVIAADAFGLRLLSQNETGHDAMTKDNRRVEIKTTQRKSVAFRSIPEQVIVLRLLASGDAELIYNGPGRIASRAFGKTRRNGQRSAACSSLARLFRKVPVHQQLPLIRTDLIRQSADA
jgi:hypothetical protein